MQNTIESLDRRSTIKEKHRTAIVDAASSIMRATLSSDFSVDELAHKADVSRRTIFNHFASLDDVIIEVFGNELGAVVEELSSNTPDALVPGRSMLDELSDTFRATDMVSPMVYLTSVLSCEDPKIASRREHLASRAFSEISARLSREMFLRHPAADPLTVGLLVSSMTNGLMVMYVHWTAASGAVDTIESRIRWSQLMDRLIESLRTGFGAS